MICVILLCVIIFNTFALESSKGKSCVTPYGETATCKLLQECGVILSGLITEGDRGQRLFKDSQCGCDIGMVCCGTYNNKSYTPLIGCAPPPKPERILVGKVSDGSICGLDSSTDRIKGGGAVKFQEHPWIAALEYQSTLTNENAGFRCGGSVITESYVLTAAHCIVDVEFMLIKVWLGLTNTSSEEYCPNVNAKVQCINTVHKMNVKNTIPHEFYNSLDKFNDVGLIQLEKAIKFSLYIRPICLPSSDSELPRIGTYMTVAGWGTTESGKSSEIKLKVEVPLKDNDICNEYLQKFYEEITPKQLCVGGVRGKDACQGDSGGPLMYDLVGVTGDVQWYQQGIVSYGTGCGIQGRPGIYIKVSSYVNWIYSKIHNTNKGLERDEPCTSLNDTIGTCVPLTTCEEVFKAISTKNESRTHHTSKSHCSYDKQGDELIVCCENPGSIVIPNWNSTALPDKAACGILKTELRIDGTEIKDLANFPWVAGIEYFSKDSNTSEIKCVGTVINSRYVLTSLHCIFMNPVNVWLGHWNTSAYHDCKAGNNTVDCTNSVQTIKIKTVIDNPFYPLDIFFLETEIRFSDYISAICLPLPNVPKIELGISMTVLRWTGQLTYYGLITSSDMILKEEVSLVSNDKCPHPTVLASRDLCAGDESKNSCNRILGAPIMRRYEDKPSGRMQWYLEGVVTFVSAVDCTGVDKDYAVYTPVATDMAWIINIISGN